MMRDHARMRLKGYATRHRMRPTGWHFMLDQLKSTSEGGVIESALVIMRCSGERYYCIRVSVEADAEGRTTTQEKLGERDILTIDMDRVAHLIFSRDGWTETRAIKKDSDKIIEDAQPAPDQTGDES